jgi:hypothetical protein
MRILKKILLFILKVAVVVVISVLAVFIMSHGWAMMMDYFL